MEEIMKKTIQKRNWIVELLIVFWLVRQGVDFVFLYLGNGYMYSLLLLIFNVFTYATVAAGFVLFVRKDLVKECFGIVTGLTLIFMLNYIAYPQNIDAINTIMKMSITTIPCYILVRSLKETYGIVRIMSVISYLLIPLVAFIQLTGRNISTNNYLTVSYSILPSIILLIGLQYQRFKLSRLLILLLGIMILIVYGGRMPLVILVFSFVLYEIKNYRDKDKDIKRIIKYICLSLAALVFVLYINEIKDFIIRKYVVQDTYSRTIVRILESNLLDYSGRDTIYGKSIELIKKNPVIGNGIGADSIMIREEKLFSVNYDIHNLGGLHAHNGILEFAIEFGLILLGFALYFLGRTCIYAYKHVEIKDDFIFLVLLLSIGIIRTALGNPYWYSQAFWMALAWCIVIRNKQLSKNNK